MKICIVKLNRLLPSLSVASLLLAGSTISTAALASNPTTPTQLRHAVYSKTSAEILATTPAHTRLELIMSLTLPP